MRVLLVLLLEEAIRPSSWTRVVPLGKTKKNAEQQRKERRSLRSHSNSRLVAQSQNLNEYLIEANEYQRSNFYQAISLLNSSVVSILTSH